MNLNDLTVEQLKALAYDELKRFQQVQHNLQVIEQIIEQKIKELTENNAEVIEND